MAEVTIHVDLSSIARECGRDGDFLALFLSELSIYLTGDTDNVEQALPVGFAREFGEAADDGAKSLLRQLLAACDAEEGRR